VCVDCESGDRMQAGAWASAALELVGVVVSIRYLHLKGCRVCVD